MSHYIPHLNKSTPLKGFTLKSPWLASAMMHGQKRIENRTQDWKPGWYAVHVGVGKEDPWCEKHVRENVTNQFYMKMVEDDIRDGLVPRGHIIGLVYIQYTLPITEAKESNASGWAIGPFCMVISHRFFLKKPVETRGQLGAWGVRGEVHTAVAAQIDADNAIGWCIGVGVRADSRTLRVYKEQLLLVKWEQQQVKRAEKRKREGSVQNLVQSKLVAFEKE